MFLGIRDAGEDDVCELGAFVAVMALVDYERVFGEVGGRDLVCAEEPDDFRYRFGYSGGRYREADFVGAGAGCGALEDVVALPVGREEVSGVFVDEGADGFEDGLGVGVLDCEGADDDHGALCALEEFAKGAGEGFLEVGGVVAKVLEFEGGFEGSAYEPDFEVGSEPLFADTGVETGGFVARIGADKENGVRFFDAVDFGVESVV